MRNSMLVGTFSHARAHYLSGRCGASRNRQNEIAGLRVRIAGHVQLPEPVRCVGGDCLPISSAAGPDRLSAARSLIPLVSVVVRLVAARSELPRIAAGRPGTGTLQHLVR
jgi:hypothetical protein